MSGLCLGISGVARSGKDTFSAILKRRLLGETEYVVSIAFADALKQELLDDMLARYGISTFTQNSQEKSVIRPWLVHHGKKMRDETNGRYWIDKIDRRVRDWIADGGFVIVTDCRYSNEANWIHELGGKTIYVQRLLPNGEVVLPANDEEKANDPAVRALADITVSLPTISNEQKILDSLRPIVYDAWSQIMPKKQ